MRIEFSKHSLERLKLRTTITKDMVLWAVVAPDAVKPSFRSRLLYQKRYGSSVLEVVVVKEDNKLLVIAEYFLEQS